MSDTLTANPTDDHAENPLDRIHPADRLSIPAVLVSDGEDLSTTELLRRTARALGRPARLLPVPQSWLRTAAALLGSSELGQRLCGSLQVDISATREALGWRPPVSVNEALVSTAQHFLEARRK